MTSKLPTLPLLRTPYNYDRDQVSLDTGLSCPEPTLAQQNARDECDINVIMERFGRGMALPDNFSPPQYGDFVGINDYHSAMNQVAAARESFDSMPANLRARFNNDPGQLMAFLDDSENRQEAVKLGLVPPPPETLPAAPQAPSEPVKP